jgi:hypothetical protein
MRHTVFIIILILLLATSASAQEKIELFERSDRSNYILFSGQIGKQKTIDEGVSPLLYKGLIFGGGLGYKSEKRNRIWDIKGSFLYGFQYSSTRFNTGVLTAYNIDIDGRYLFNVDYESVLPFQAYFGLQAMHSMRLRLNEKMFNAALGYDIITALGISTELKKSIKVPGFNINLWRWKYTYHPHKVTFDTNIDLPLLFLYLRPTYVVIENFVDGRTEPYDFERSESSSIGDIIHITVNTGINYHLRNQNIIRFGYIWQYYKIDPEYSPVQGAQHLFQLTFKFKMNKSNYDEAL